MVRTGGPLIKLFPFLNQSDIRTLRFGNGTEWFFGCRSAEGEPDRGVHPTVIKDAIGNTWTVRYEPARDAFEADSSSRIAEISDNRGPVYTFSYADLTGYPGQRRLKKIVNDVTSTAVTFEYASDSFTVLTAPENGLSAPVRLQSIKNVNTGSSASFQYDLLNSGEQAQPIPLEKSASIEFMLGNRLICTYAVDDEDGSTTLYGCDLTGLPPDAGGL